MTLAGASQILHAISAGSLLLRQGPKVQVGWEQRAGGDCFGSKLMTLRFHKIFDISIQHIKNIIIGII